LLDRDDINTGPSVLQVNEETVTIGSNRSHNSLSAGESFVFDEVEEAQVGQEDIFCSVSKPITENCLLGYNGTIFA